MARSTPTRKFAALAVAGALAFGTYQIVSSTCGDSLEAQRLANQVWIERLPTDDRDMIHHLVLIEDGRDRFGAFGKSSQWRHFIELFRWAREDSRLTLLLPQERKRLDLGVRIWDCEGEAPAPFQLCLELSNKRKSMTYYSRHDWAIDGDMDAVLAAQPELAGLLEQPVAPAIELAAAEFALSEEFAE